MTITEALSTMRESADRLRAVADAVEQAMALGDPACPNGDPMGCPRCERVEACKDYDASLAAGAPDSDAAYRAGLGVRIAMAGAEVE